MFQNTHPRISPRLVGTPTRLEQDLAEATLQTLPEMQADEEGLVHGGFTFGLADFAAMLAINAPTVVLGSATTRFLAPVRVGDCLLARARVARREGKKHVVEVEVYVLTSTAPGGASVSGLEPQARVLEGELTCFVPSRHVLAPRE